MNPRVTVVIPTHRRPELMRLAVESVLAQDSEAHGEVIVVFDACPVVLPEVDVPRGWTIRGIENTRSRGLAGARNSGILAATGDLIAFLDDDDAWLPGKLQAQVDRWREAPDAVVIGTSMEVDDGERRHVRLVPSEELTHDDFLANRQPGLHSSSLLFPRSELQGRLGLIDEDLPRSYGEDYDILLRASAIGRVTVVNEPLIRVRWQGQSYFFGQWASYAAALQYLLDKHPDFATHPRAQARIRAQIAFALASSRQPGPARAIARQAIIGDFRQVKAYLAVAISWRLTTPTAVTKVVQRLGRGI